jgi:hypothetical protein
LPELFEVRKGFKSLSDHESTNKTGQKQPAVSGLSLSRGRRFHPVAHLPIKGRMREVFMMIS